MLSHSRVLVVVGRLFSNFTHKTDVNTEWHRILNKGIIKWNALTCHAVRKNQTNAMSIEVRAML